MINLFRSRPTVFAGSIILLAYLMKSDRREYFLEWLCSHSAQIVCDKEDTPNRIHDSLVVWFESLSESEALYEYELVIREIGWWRDLKEEALAYMLDDRQAVQRNFYL